MKIKKIKRIEVDVQRPDKDDDWNIYIDTDSVFFSAVPLLDYRRPNWKDNEQGKIAEFVDEIAGEMQDYLNQFYDILAPRVFNVSKETHRLEIKKEYIAKAGIWVAKKRYAQWIIMNNGVPTDKLDVKGLDVVRSSFPTSFAKLMKTVLIEILRDKTQDDLRDLIMTFKHNMGNLNVSEISKNSSIKDIGKYLGDDHIPFRFKKGATAHVKAAIAYNDMLVHFNVPFKHSPIRDTDKIKWAYLKNNPFGIETIGFIGYNDPPEIMEFINTYIDHDMLFERELEKKLQDFYDVLGWGKVINEQRAAEQFFNFG